MSKHKHLTTTAGATPYGRALAALQAQGAKIAEDLNGSNSLRLVKADKNFSLLMKHGNTTVQIEGDSFAVTTHD